MTQDAEILGRDDALKAIESNQSRRYHKLDRLERYVSTTQYEGRQDWFASGDGAKPLLERAPCIAYPIVKAAIYSNTDLLLGNGRYPAFSLEDSIEDDDDSADDEENSDYELVETCLNDAAKQSRLSVAAAEVFSDSQGCGTGVSIYGVRNSRLFIDTTKAKWCTPEFELDGSVKRLEIRYPYLITERRETDGKLQAKARLYRRVIDAERDVTYLPADADRYGREPKWSEDKAQSFNHGLGHCPVIWYPHMRGCAAVNEIDGKAIHCHSLDEIFAHDVAISQRHRAALMAGDPQWTEIGVEPGEGPAATGRTPRDIVRSTATGGLPSKDNPVLPGSYDMSSPKPSRKKGPGEVWQYPNSDVQVKLHTLPGDALKAIDDHARDLRIKIAESLAVVFLDPEAIKFAASMSGKALSTLKGRQLDRVDRYREDFGDNWLIPQIQGLLKVIRAVGGNLKLRNAARCQAAIDTIGGIPDIELCWGEYFKPSPEEEEKLLSVAIDAMNANLMTPEMALKKLRRVLGIVDVESALEKLEELRQKKRAESQEDGLAEQKALHAIANGQTPGQQDPSRMAASPPSGAARTPQE